MPSNGESALEFCQRVETILRNVQEKAQQPGVETLAECETALGQALVLLEALHKSVQENPASPMRRALQQALPEIKPLTSTLKAQFDHGSNYCMGLLQIRLGSGYSAQGLPVLVPSESRSSFEG